MAIKPQKQPYWPYDLLFILCAAIFAILTYKGSLALSANGAAIDSDLQTYAQGMAGEAERQLFAADPVLKIPTPANSINNLERVLAGWLSQGQGWAAGLLAAGAIIIFVFLVNWYFLGRWLYEAPNLGALLAAVCSITIWVGWGTFWGILHSDPVPRVFFAAFCLCSSIWLLKA